MACGDRERGAPDSSIGQDYCIRGGVGGPLPKRRKKNLEDSLSCESPRRGGEQVRKRKPGERLQGGRGKRGSPRNPGFR